MIFFVFGDSFDDCLTNLKKVLNRCEEKILVLNWEKFHFIVTNGIVLGHIVSSTGIEVDKSKIELIATLPTPKSIKDVRSFLGHAGFYRRFIKDFSVISKPLSNLLDAIQPSKDPLEVPVTRLRAKKFKEAFNGLLQDTWAKVDFKRICNNKEQALINLIHVQEGLTGGTKTITQGLGEED